MAIAEIEVATGRVVQVKLDPHVPVWPAGRRGVVLDPRNPNHALDLTQLRHYTVEGTVFTLHPPGSGSGEGE